MNNFGQKPANPLANFMRQPKIYIRLPSDGAYWEDGSLVMPETRELPVYSMTAQDELTFKTPDALLNGQAVVDVIQSCIPNIKNAWSTPNLDIDVILIAIRIATYGETMEIGHKVPNTQEEAEHVIDLRYIIDHIMSNSQWNEVVEINETLTFYIRPLTYKHLTRTSIKTFEAQRLMQTINNDDLSDEKKLEIFNRSFKEMSSITVELLVDSIIMVQAGEHVVKDRAFIKEFIENADTSIVQKIQDHIESLKTKSGIQPLTINATPEQIELGAPVTYELPISMDNSNFFARGS